MGSNEIVAVCNKDINTCKKNFDSTKAFWRMGRGEARSLKQIFNYKLYIFNDLIQTTSRIRKLPTLLSCFKEL